MDSRCPPWTSTGCRGTAPLWGLQHSLKENLHSGTSLLHWSWYLQSCFSCIFQLLLHSFRGFIPLIMLYRGTYSCCWWAQPQTAVELSWSQLALALSGMGKLLEVSVRSHPCFGTLLPKPCHENPIYEARICSLMAEENICKTSNYSTSHWLELALTYALLMLKFTYLLASTQFVQRYFLF